MKTKRFLSLFMTLALCLSLALGLPVPALAADPVTYLDPWTKGIRKKSAPVTARSMKIPRLSATAGTLSRGTWNVPGV